MLGEQLKRVFGAAWDRPLRIGFFIIDLVVYGGIMITPFISDIAM
jgi:hypothetical protein